MKYILVDKRGNVRGLFRPSSASELMNTFEGRFEEFKLNKSVVKKAFVFEMSFKVTIGNSNMDEFYVFEGDKLVPITDEEYDNVPTNIR